MRSRTSRQRAGWWRALALIAGLSAGAIGCSSESAPEVPAGPDGSVDPVLVAGRDIYSRRCATCHGAGGDGARGPKLADGRVLERYPEVADQLAVVTGGRGGMPAFEGVLQPEEIEAVVRYTREVLPGP